MTTDDKSAADDKSESKADPNPQPPTESVGSAKINNALAARIVAARKLLDAQARESKGEAADGSTGSGSGSGSGSANDLPSYVPRSKQAGVSSAGGAAGTDFRIDLPVAATVLPITIGVVCGIVIGCLTSWFHPSQSKVVSLAGAPFILYFCFKTSSAASSSGERLTPAQLQRLLSDRNTTPNARRKAVSDEYSAIAEQYVKYGLATGFMLAIGWQFVGTFHHALLQVRGRQALTD